MTRAQRVVYDALAACEEANGRWPVPVRVIQARAGIASTSTVHRHLHNLARLGLVEKSPYGRAGWRVKPRR